MRRAGRAVTFICTRLLCLCASIALSAGIKYGVPIEINHWETGRTPLKHMVDVTNEFGLKVLAEHNFLNDNNIAFSPYGLMGIMVALFEGVDGDSSYEIQRAMQLPWNRNVMRVGFRDIHRTLKTYFVPEEGFLAGLALNSENVIFNENYKLVLRFYGFDIEGEQVTTTSTIPTTSNTNETSATTSSTENMSTTDKGETTTNPSETPTTEEMQESTTTSTETTPSSTTVKTTTSQTAQTSLTSTTEMSTSTKVTSTPEEITSTTATNKPSSTTVQIVNGTTSMTTASGTGTTSNTTMSENIISTTESMTTGTTNITSTTAANMSTTEIITSPTTPSSTSGSTLNMQNVSTSGSVTPPTENISTTGSTTNMQTVPTVGSVTPPTVNTSTTGIATNMQTVPTVGSVTPPTVNTSTTGITTNMQTVPTLGSVTPPTVNTSTTGITTNMQTVPTVGSVTLPTVNTSTNGITTTMQTVPTSESVTPPTVNLSTPASVAPSTVTLSTPRNPLETLARRKKSIVDYLFTNPSYVDDYPAYRSFDVGPDFSNIGYGGDEGESYFGDDVKYIPPYTGLDGSQMFLANGIKKVPVTYMSYDAVLEHAYLPHLDASALRLPLDSDRYYLLLVLPSRKRAGEVARLLARMARLSDLSDVYGALRPKRVRALVPSFFVKGHVTLTTDLQRLGIRNVFQPRQNDFTPMTSQAGVYVRSIEQAVSVAIRKYSPDETKKLGHAANRQRAYFSATYPFLYFVMDANINVALMAGKLVDPLNSRIL